MKLKISDEKLDELAESYSFANGYVGFRNGYITASAEYQATVDKLTEIISKMKSSIVAAEMFLTSCGYDKAEECEPDYQMLMDFRKTLAEVEILEKGLG